MKLVKCARIFTAAALEPENILRDRVIVLENGKITALEPFEIIEGTGLAPEDIVDFTGEDLFVLPGLIDTHLHLAHSGTDISEKADPDPLVSIRMAHNAFQNLKAGITTVRDMGAKNHIDVHFRRGVMLDLIPSPRVIICGQPIIMTGGHCTYMGREADGPFEVARAVREQLKVAVDFIKLMVTGGIMTPDTEMDALQLQKEEIKSAVSVAHNAGRRVASHAQGGPGVQLTIDCGVDSLEHGIFLTEDHIERMYKKGTYYTPTLSAIRDIAQEGPALGLPEWAVEKTRVATEHHKRSFQMARSAGITIAAGTDYRHGTLSNELELMVSYGTSCEEALLSATSVAAKIMDKDDQLGSIEPGKLADLTVVRGNPLNDIRCLKNIHAVVIGGAIKWRNSLESFE